VVCIFDRISFFFQKKKKNFKKEQKHSEAFSRTVMGQTLSDVSGMITFTQIRSVCPLCQSVFIRLQLIIGVALLVLQLSFHFQMWTAKKRKARCVE
jgi:hypothetical protein